MDFKGGPGIKDLVLLLLKCLRGLMKEACVCVYVHLSLTRKIIVSTDAITTIEEFIYVRIFKCSKSSTSKTCQV